MKPRTSVKAMSNLLIGYFEGIDSERGIAWRTADSLALRGFLGAGPRRGACRALDDLADTAADRRRNASRGVTWILQVLATADLIKGATIGIDATTLEANAARRSIVRRDSGETYQEFLMRLAQAWHRDADAGSEAPEERPQSGLATSARSRCAPQ